MDVMVLVRRVAEAGGEISISDDEGLEAVVREAESQKLVETFPDSGGWGASVGIRLTNAGRRLVGLHVETPSPKRRWLWSFLPNGLRPAR